jgi:TetR/AcrR family transcriptional regulator, fatty acid metabolism regulator protein
MSVQERHRRERSARRQTILEAAAAVFAKHGLDGATIEMVARAAEVAVGTIYLYFSSRDDLFLQLTFDRVETLVTRYSEIQARGLDPLAELRTMAAAYIEYLCESRELFLIHQSVGYARIRKRLKRKAEIQHHDRVLALSHRAFGQWERAVGRVYEQGLISTVMDLATTASVMWASINGAFLLTGQDHAFRAITGLSPDHFVEQAFEFHLNAAQALAGHHAHGKPAPTHKANGVAASGRAKNKARIQQDDDTAAA